jgi:signal transduction histidine kinase
METGRSPQPPRPSEIDSPGLRPVVRAFNAGAPTGIPGSPGSEARMAASFSALARLHSATSHALRSPLNTIALELEVLRVAVDEARSELPVGLTESFDRSLGVLDRALNQFTASFEQFLRHTRAPAQAPQVFDFRGSIAGVAETLQASARNRQIELEVRISPPTDPQEGTVEFQGCREQLELAVLLLALDGLDAMREGGRLLLALESTRERVAITVADTGSIRPGRDGLGLSVARAIVLEHHGQLAVEPGVAEAGQQIRQAAERGNRFRIELPRPPVPENPD